MPFGLSGTKQSGKGSTRNGVATLARNHAPVLACTSLSGNPVDHQARYIEAAVQGVLITSNQYTRIHDHGEIRSHLFLGRDELVVIAKFLGLASDTDNRLATTLFSPLLVVEQVFQ